MIELGSSLYTAMEEANFLLHHIWIHILGSEYHPQVKQFSFVPEEIEVEPDPEKWLPLPPRFTANPESMSDDEWREQRAAFHEQLSRKEQEAVSNIHSRVVHFTILARKTDNLETHETYQLTFTVYLRAIAPAMEWQANYVSEVIVTDVRTGEQKAIPIGAGVLDCMNTRYHPLDGGGSRFERAKQYFS